MKYRYLLKKVNNIKQEYIETQQSNVNSIFKYGNYFIHDPIINSFINFVMKDGKKYQSYYLFFSILNFIKKHVFISPLLVLKVAISNCRVYLGIKTLRYRRREHHYPIIINSKKSIANAMRLILITSNDNYLFSSVNLSKAEKFAVIILNIFFKQGPILDVINNTYLRIAKLKNKMISTQAHTVFPNEQLDDLRNLDTSFDLVPSLKNVQLNSGKKEVDQAQQSYPNYINSLLSLNYNSEVYNKQLSFTNSSLKNYENVLNSVSVNNNNMEFLSSISLINSYYSYLSLNNQIKFKKFFSKLLNKYEKTRHFFSDSKEDINRNLLFHKLRLYYNRFLKKFNFKKTKKWGEMVKLKKRKTNTENVNETSKVIKINKIIFKNLLKHYLSIKDIVSKDLRLKKLDNLKFEFEKLKKKEFNKSKGFQFNTIIKRKTMKRKKRKDRDKQNFFKRQFSLNNFYKYVESKFMVVKHEFSYATKYNKSIEKKYFQKTKFRIMRDNLNSKKSAFLTKYAHFHALKDNLLKKSNLLLDSTFTWNSFYAFVSCEYPSKVKQYIFNRFIEIFLKKNFINSNIKFKKKSLFKLISAGAPLKMLLRRKEVGLSLTRLLNKLIRKGIVKSKVKDKNALSIIKKNKFSRKVSNKYSTDYANKYPYKQKNLSSRQKWMLKNRTKQYYSKYGSSFKHNNRKIYNKMKYGIKNKNLLKSNVKQPLRITTGTNMPSVINNVFNKKNIYFKKYLSFTFNNFYPMLFKNVIINKNRFNYLSMKNLNFLQHWSYLLHIRGPFSYKFFFSTNKNNYKSLFWGENRFEARKRPIYPFVPLKKTIYFKKYYGANKNISNPYTFLLNLNRKFKVKHPLFLISPDKNNKLKSSKYSFPAFKTNKAFTLDKLSLKNKLYNQSASLIRNKDFNIKTVKSKMSHLLKTNSIKSNQILINNLFKEKHKRGISKTKLLHNKLKKVYTQKLLFSTKNYYFNLLQIDNIKHEFRKFLYGKGLIIKNKLIIEFLTKYHNQSFHLDKYMSEEVNKNIRTSYYFSLFKHGYESLNKYIFPSSLGIYKDVCFLNNMMIINLLDYNMGEDSDLVTSNIENNTLLDYKKQILYPYNEKLILARKSVTTLSSAGLKEEIDLNDYNKTISTVDVWDPDVDMKLKLEDEKETTKVNKKINKEVDKKTERFSRFYEKRNRGYFKYVKSRDGSLRKRQNSIIQFIE